MRRYEKDTQKTGIASDYGKILYIRGAVQADQILYQTERYNTGDFGYNIPVPFEGNFVLVMKFAEVFHDKPDMQAFDVVVNGEHVVVKDLDIFQRIGYGTAYDLVVPFTVEQGKNII